tara:strand:+ start:158 stop:1195 length:1038 start_codon:yes stop_codon:yes gene_type:complete
MSWKDIVKAKTGSKRGGSKPDRKKVLTKPKGSGTLHEDIKAFKEGKLEGTGPFDEKLSPEEIEEMKEFYALYPELDEYGFTNVLENPQWVKDLKKPDKPYTVAHHLNPEHDFLIRDLQQKMVNHLETLFLEFNLFLGSSGFETSRRDPENDPHFPKIPIKREGRFQQLKSFSNLFPLYSKLIKQLTWDDNWEKEANSEGFDVSKNILWGVKTIHYDVKERTGANVRHRTRERSSAFEYESEPAGQPSMVHVLVFMRGTIDFENLNYKFYTLKYTTGMERDIIPSGKVAQGRRESDYREISDENYRAYYRHMLNAAETDVLTISGEEPDSTIINKLRSFFGYYLRL